MITPLSEQMITWSQEATHNLWSVLCWLDFLSIHRHVLASFHSLHHALCGYPLVKMELEIQTRFLPRLPFSCNSIISDIRLCVFPRQNFPRDKDAQVSSQCGGEEEIMHRKLVVTIPFHFIYSYYLKYLSKKLFLLLLIPRQQKRDRTPPRCYNCN